MIYITGDKHRSFSRLYYFCHEQKTTQNDIIIVLGDAGINYTLDERDYYVKKSLSELNVTLFLVYGNHEQRPNLIDSYEEIEWCGGKAYVEKEFPYLIFAKCGEIYNINGYKTLVIGGAYSVDKFYRLNSGAQWFENEQPDESIKKLTETNLQANNWNVDIVLSHTAPEKYEPREVFLSGIDQSTVDKTTEIWLDEIENKLDYKKWYLGHYHCEKVIDKIEIMFHAVKEFGC